MAIVSDPSRRSFIAAAPFLAVTEVAPAKALDADVGLSGLGERFARTWEAVAAASPAFARAESRFFEARRSQHHRLDESRITIALDAAEKRYMRAVDAHRSAIQVIAQTSTRTSEGLLFKAEIAVRTGYDGGRFSVDHQ